jgi:hypothetical protein
VSLAKKNSLKTEHKLFKETPMKELFQDFFPKEKRDQVTAKKLQCEY